MNPERDNTGGPPKLPPPPLAQIEPAPPPDVPLPWSTVPFGAVAGLIVGVGLWVVLTAVRGGPQLPVWGAAYQGGADAVLGLLMVFGAAVLDRLAPSWPRGVRWACGMGAAPLAGLGLLVGLGHLLSGQGPGVSISDVLGVFASTSVSCAFLGGVLGLAGGSSRDLLWRLPLAGFTAMAVVVALHFGLWRLLGVPFLGVGVAGSMVAPVLGLLLGLIMAERLNAARRKAVE